VVVVLWWWYGGGGGGYGAVVVVVMVVIVVVVVVVITEAYRSYRQGCINPCARSNGRLNLYSSNKYLCVLT
jgi:uncharacterized membrane protein